MKKTKLNEKELEVLRCLAEAYHPDEDEWGAYGFKALSSITGLDAKNVRRACRSLARKGLAAYERGLWSDDGPAGAGYRATEEGAAYIFPCDVCGKRATYEYNVEKDGSFTMNDDENTTEIRECGQHYGMSFTQKKIL